MKLVKNKIFMVEMLVILGLIVGMIAVITILSNEKNNADASEFKTENGSSTAVSSQQYEGMETPSDSSTLSESERIKQRVRENPDAGLEAIDEATLKKSKFLIKTLPKGLVEKELKRQLDEGYITQRQFDEYMKLVNEK